MKGKVAICNDPQWPRHGQTCWLALQPEVKVVSIGLKTIMRVHSRQSIFASLTINTTIKKINIHWQWIKNSSTILCHQDAQPYCISDPYAYITVWAKRGTPWFPLITIGVPAVEDKKVVGALCCGPSHTVKHSYRWVFRRRHIHMPNPPFVDHVITFVFSPHGQSSPAKANDDDSVKDKCLLGWCRIA